MGASGRKSAHTATVFTTRYFDTSHNQVKENDDMYVTFKQPGTGKSRNLKVGFSWLFLLATPFYGIPQFAKGIWKHGIGVFAIGVFAVLSMGSPSSALVGLALIAAAAFYGINGNKIVAKTLLSKGWTMEGDDHTLHQARIRWGLEA